MSSTTTVVSMLNFQYSREVNIPEQYLPCHWFISANTGDVAQQLVDRAAFSWWSSVIHTLCCREIVPVWMEMVAYSQLSQLDYIHHTVNHPRNFKDPVAGVCINRVDRSGIWSQWILSKCIFMPLVVMQETRGRPNVTLIVSAETETGPKVYALHSAETESRPKV